MSRELAEVTRLLAEIMCLVEEARQLDKDGEPLGAVAVRRELDSVRWRLAGVVSRNAAFSDRAAA